MTRVSENSSTASLQYSLNKAKSKLENLQLKGASLKRIVKPSDDPVSSVEALNISSISSDNKQFLRNASFAGLHLASAEKAIEQLTDILGKGKEIAIAQSSDFYDVNIRKNVANEIRQLRNQALSIANKRVGSRYIFSGHSTLKAPFNADGQYQGDKGKINLEVSKDFFVPINLTGDEVFYADGGEAFKSEHPLKKIDISAEPKEGGNLRTIASVEEPELVGNPVENVAEANRENIFALLSTLTTALENNDSTLIQDLLNKFDSASSRLITLRTRIGSLVNSVENASNNVESENIDHAERKSFLVDADVAELFSDISRQKSILETTYHSSTATMNKTLLDFLR